jgi:aspartate/methionine/tyrosine aminotransferase
MAAQDFIPFELERMMSIWENQVEYNLSESGVHPLTLRELIGDDEAVLDELLSTLLNYPQTNGDPALRQTVAGLYRQAGPENVLVTVGAIQANLAAVATALQPGDEMAVMLPNYMQIWGIAKNLGCRVNPFYLKEELGWGLDIEELNRAVTPDTKMIAVCNPNNPTGHILTREEREAVIRAASRVGAWLLADEVYAGAERLSDEVTPSFWGEYEKVIAVGSLSKAYGLPGLRVGWLVAPPEFADQAWARQDYITISSAVLSNRLANFALQPAMRARLLDRTRRYIRTGYGHFEEWLKQHPDIFSLVPPQAAAIAFPRYHRQVNSRQLLDQLIKEHKTYIVPGDHFGLDHHLRISIGLPLDYLNEGLSRILRALLENK